MRRGAIALAAIAAAACGPAGRPLPVPEGTGPLVGTYKCELQRAGEPSRRARLLLWAQAPDRLHAELLPPAGGSPLTLDAGAGRAVLVDVSEKTAYAGEAGPEAIGSLTGVRIGVAEAVGALLHGAPVATGRVERAPDPAGQLPSRFSVEVGSSRLGLTLVRWERSSRAESALGTGAPPDGMRVLPFDAWPP